MNRSAKSVIKIASFSLLALVIIGYSTLQAWKIIQGPVIEIYSPENGRTFTQTLIEVEGRAKNISHLNLNDRPIFTDKTGYFKEKILLSPGYNVIKLDATDKFKKYIEKRLYLVLKEY